LISSQTLSQKSDEKPIFNYDQDDIFERLNEMQKQAICFTEAPLLILAGVGTGKTETLMRKYSYLIGHKGYHPTNIMSVTFTNKASRSMKERAAKILKCTLKALDCAWISTFHALSLRILKENNNYKLVGLKDDFHPLEEGD
jgi:DNA helicase II / ATP-dependent DNA helicase PcrA